MIWRSLYSTLWIVLTPLLRRYLRKRAKRAPAYLEHWDERFGKDAGPVKQGAIWIHAVSVGETRAALPLVLAIRQQWPDVPLLITQTTPTGRQCATELYQDLAEIRYLPYDYAAAATRFIQRYQPKFGLLMETELWPNLIAAAHAADVPLFLANARLSEKSFNGYRKIRWLIGPALKQLSAVAAQTDADARRLELLGASNIQVCGNTKYDITAPVEQSVLGALFREKIGQRQVMVCASTRQGEEALILQAWAQSCSECLLVIVPRHPERFVEVAQLAQSLGFKVQLRSDQQPVKTETQVWIGDSMGELFAYYQAADLVFIGGSLLPLGGQNLIEPASVGIPVLMGPSTFNFTDASEKAFSAGAAIQVMDADELVVKINQLMNDLPMRETMQQAALKFSAAHRGASQRIVSMLARYLSH
jgi:3-deoxy-D-manno-octulosonic-acid transferase